MKTWLLLALLLATLARAASPNVVVILSDDTAPTPSAILVTPTSKRRT